LENAFYRDLKPTILLRYLAAAKSIDSRSVNKYSSRMRAIFIKHYTKAFRIFGAMLNSALEKNGLVPEIKKSDEFIFSQDIESTMARFIKIHAAAQIIKINLSTIKKIKKIILKLTLLGRTRKEIAEKIMKTGTINTPSEAMRIARTETHSMSMISQQRIASASGRVKKKEWMSALDSRVRRKLFNHFIYEIVGINDYFEKTGGLLEFPGDPGGAAGNVVNCRCVQNFLTT